MSFELFILGGYGHFVWSAFIFTFVSCFLLYLKTKKEFQKQKKMFLDEFKQLQVVRVNINKQKVIAKKVFSGSSTF